MGVRQIAVGFVCPCYTEPTFLSEKMPLHNKMENLYVGISCSTEPKHFGADFIF